MFLVFFFENVIFYQILSRVKLQDFIISLCLFSFYFFGKIHPVIQLTWHFLLLQFVFGMKHNVILGSSMGITNPMDDFMIKTFFCQS